MSFDGLAVIIEKQESGIKLSLSSWHDGIPGGFRLVRSKMPWPTSTTSFRLYM